MSDIRRREFLALLGCAAARPLAARAQQPEAVRRVGILISGGEADPEMQARVAAIRQRLDRLGWSEGRNLRIDIRFAEGDPHRHASLARELVARQPDAIIAYSTPIAAALRRESHIIPIVFVNVSDPIGSGLVASLARPGGNITGLSIQQTDLNGKRLELMREVLPDLRRLAIMANVDAPIAVQDMREVQTAARTLGFEVATFEIRRAEDIAPGFEGLNGRADALYVCGDPLMDTHRVRINMLALAARLPTMHGVREYVEAGGLMSYGPSFTSLFRRTADLVDKILRGAKPSDIPVEQPTKFELVINAKTAKALGLTVPPSLLARADEVIE
jgi:putative tryptophan/tyrosine transport system substrate-binding protein